MIPDARRARCVTRHEFDLVVIGTGTGLDVANWAAESGLRVAIVEKGRLGGTCLNRGCIPSKLLIHCADVAETVRRAGLFGIRVNGFEVDFPAIVRRATASVDSDSDAIEAGLRATENPRLFQGEGRFVGEKRLRVNGEDLVAEKFLLAHGARPTIPPIEGLADVPYLTSTEALRLPKQPASMIVVGGGYIGCELGHFYASLGTRVTILGRRPNLLPGEDEEIAHAFTRAFARRVDVRASTEVKRVARDGDGVRVEAVHRETGETSTLRADALLVATGVTPNSDTLDLAKTGVKVDAEGYVDTDDYLETSAPGIFALGDAVGNFLFKHSANHEAKYVIQNLLDPARKVAVDYHAMPHAVFGSPQVAGVGYTEQELRRLARPHVVGKYRTRETAMGHAIEDEDGFVKFLVEPESGKILGCHIIGHEASTLIHEVVVAMTAGEGTLANVRDAIHVHPALSEVVQRAADAVPL